MSEKRGFIIYLTPDAIIWQRRLPRGLVYNSEEKTLRSETGKLEVSTRGLSGKVEGGSFSIGTRLVIKVTDIEGSVQFQNESCRAG
jgi:hypothetical protein